MNSSVTLENLVIVKEKNEILHSISMEIPEGKIVGLLGPSGSGKTTMMRAIAGLQIIKSGTTLVLGEAAGSKSLRSLVSYSTQSASVYGDLTVTENMKFFASLYPHNEYEIDEILKLVDLTKVASQLASTLSGGERARLALATALVGKPKLIILDEPTVGLDPVLRQQLWQLFRTLVSMGKTLLVSSHVMDEAINCDYLFLLRDGSVLANGKVSDLRTETGISDMEKIFISLVKGKK